MPFCDLGTRPEKGKGEQFKCVTDFIVGMHLNIPVTCSDTYLGGYFGNEEVRRLNFVSN